VFVFLFGESSVGGQGKRSRLNTNKEAATGDNQLDQASSPETGSTSGVVGRYDLVSATSFKT
jgi:hypothetical protein